MTDQLSEIIIEYSDDEQEDRELTQYSYISNHLCFEYFVGYEIATLLGYKNTRSVIQQNVSKCNQLPFREYPGPRIPELDPRTILITRDGACEILLKTRKLITPDVAHILKKFGIETTNKKCLTKEQQSLSDISNVFKTEKHEFQHPIGSYVLDMYFTEYKIVIECDEGNHSSYSPKKEAERVRYINTYLGIDDNHWIRFNPDENNYDIAKIVGKIYIKINQFRDDVIPLKRCCTCRTEKKQTDFGVNKGNPDGFEKRCKECRTNIYHQITKNKNKEIVVPVSKVCPQCEVNLEANMFTNSKSRKDGLNNICKTCEKKRREEIKNMVKEIPEFKKCSSCNEHKSSDKFYNRSKSMDGLYGQCKICMQKREKKWRENRK